MKLLQKNNHFLSGLFLGIGISVVVGSLIYWIAGTARAVTFDSDIVPTPGSSMKVGVAQGQIQSINNVLYFSGQAVGIGGTPTQPSNVRLEVFNGGMRFNNLTARPSCTSSLRGTMWYSPGTPGQIDSVAVCYWNGLSYVWAVFQGK